MKLGITHDFGDLGLGASLREPKKTSVAQPAEGLREIPYGESRLGAAGYLALRKRSELGALPGSVQGVAQFRFLELVKKARSARDDVLAALEPIQKLSRVSAVTLPTSGGKERAKKRTVAFARALDRFEAARCALLSMQDVSVGQSRVARLAFGGTNRDVQSTEKLSKQQLAALDTFLTRFSSPEALGIEPGILAKGVAPASNSVLMSLCGAIRSQHASVDAQGAANMDHLASVFAGVLETEAKRLGRPLDQSDADRLAFNTVCTDVWMKGNSAESLASVKTAPTNAGQDGQAISVHLKATAKLRYRQGVEVSANVGRLIDAWIDRGFVPMAPAEVEKEGQAARLDENERAELIAIWGRRIMASGDFWNMQSFMLGVWLHGIPAFETVKNVVDSAAGKHAEAKEVYYCVLGHHMAGFIAAGLARGNLALNFAQMETSGELPSGAAEKLERLYRSAVDLAAKWRPEIEAATKGGSGLTKAQREAFRKEASALRAAVAALPEDVRSQLVNDDTMQFTSIGIEKWLNMLQGSTNGETLLRVYQGSAQAYLEESLARDLGPEPGRELIERAAPVAAKLGIVLDEKSISYRHAQPGEPAFETHARGIQGDPELSQRFADHTGRAACGASSEELVLWFRRAAADPAALIRIARREDPS